MEQLNTVRFWIGCRLHRSLPGGGDIIVTQTQTPREHGTGAHQPHVNEPTGACPECYATATHSILDPPRV